MTWTDQDLSIAFQFMAKHIASLEELELLAAMVDTPFRWWDAPALSRELGIPRAVAGTLLERFAAANLLDIRVTEDVRYQFRPGTRELHDGAVALAGAYRKRPAALIQHLSGMTRPGVRDFADAFRIRRNGRR
jgi:hypothetical protein